MPVITCTHCGATGNAPDSILGQQVRCSKCKQSFLAEAPPEPEAEPAAFQQDEPADEGFPTMDDVARPSSRKPAAKRDEPEEEEASDEPPPPKVRKSPAGSSNFGEFLTFRRLGGFTLVMIAFWIMFVGVVLGSVGMIVMGFMLGSTGIVFGALVYLILGPLFIRLTCEVFAVMFTMNTTLTEIRDELRKRDVPPPPPA